GACPRGPDGPRFERVIAANRRWQAPSESTRARCRALAAHRARTSLERKRPRADSNRRIEVLQTSALPLGYGAVEGLRGISWEERETGLEPATFCMASRRSTN